jgi:hypothetical protein
MTALGRSCKLSWLAGLLALAATQPCGAEPTTPATAQWHIVETASFRILNYGPRPLEPTTGQICERKRQQLLRQWLPDEEPRPWTPKCDLVVHPTDASYEREVGAGGRTTLASALVERRGGRIAIRRIDIRGSRPNWHASALGHELVHVILADRFSASTLPRWLDEGMAIQADLPEKRLRHRHGVRQAIATGAHFRLAELWALDDYPPAGRWKAFYDQSAALVEYLVDVQGHGAFLEFVDLSLDQGYEIALRRVYGLGPGELERRWHGQLRGQANEHGPDSAHQASAVVAQPAI